MTETHEFAIIASGLDPKAEDFEDRLFDAGCDDATISFQKGVTIAEFSRRAESFARAVSSACEQLSGAGATVERVEPDHLVSLSEIAARSGLSKQAISFYTRAQRGSGFPNPVARVTSSHPLWDWSEVAAWLCDHRDFDRREATRAKIVREANLYLAGRAAPGGIAGRLEAIGG